MSVLARLVVMRPDLTPAYIEDSLLFFECSRGENTVGAFVAAMPMREQYQALDADWVFELQRSFDNGVNWANDTKTLWFVRSITIEAGPQIETLTVSGTDALCLLERRIVAWFAVEVTDNGQNYYSYKVGPADNAMRAVVRENMTSDILTYDTGLGDFPGSVFAAPLVDHRARRIMPYLVVEADTEQAAVVNVEIAWMSVLEALNAIVSAAADLGERLIYDLVYEAAQHNFVFRVWKGYRGTDLSKERLFSIPAGNLTSLRMVKDYGREITWVHAGGDGQASKKVISTVMAEDSAMSRTPFYPIETFVDCADAKNDFALITKRAQREIRKVAPRWIFSAVASDADDMRFGIHYNYGDAVMVQHREQSSVCRVARFRLRYEGGMDSIVETPLESEEFL